MNSVPAALAQLIAGKSTDFVVKSVRAHPMSQILSTFVFATVWTGISLLIAMAFVGPVLLGRTVRFEANGVPVQAGPDNLAPLLYPVLFLGLFVLIGFALFVWAIKMLNKDGDWFVGTPEKLIQWNENAVIYHDWDDCSGTVKVRKNDIHITLKTGRYSTRNNNHRWQPDIIYLIGIEKSQFVSSHIISRIDASQALQQSEATTHNPYAFS